jgi:LmbE family N-acetylglucosaminyl deacetylase
LFEYLKKVINHLPYSQSSEFRRLFRIYSNSTLKYLSSNPEKLKVTDFHRVLILSPHIDDDVIAVGGTIALCLKEKIPVKVVYMTSGNQRRYVATDIPSVRVQEAAESLEILGCTDIKFLNHHQKELILQKKAWQEIREIIIEYDPDVIFTPSFLEKNVDHYATSLILADALDRCSVKPTCCCYEVWMPSFINSFIDISNVVDIKIEAILKHKSQIATNDYSDKIINLNRYRSMYSGNGTTCCEAFWKCTSKDFIKIKKMSESYSIFDSNGKDGTAGTN